MSRASTPLYLAMIFNHTAILKLLIDAKADIYKRDQVIFGRTVLDYACHWSKVEMIVLLRNRMIELDFEQLSKSFSYSTYAHLLFQLFCIEWHQQGFFQACSQFTSIQKESLIKIKRDQEALKESTNSTTNKDQSLSPVVEITKGKEPWIISSLIKTAITACNPKNWK